MILVANYTVGRCERCAADEHDARMVVTVTGERVEVLCLHHLLDAIRDQCRTTKENKPCPQPRQPSTSPA